MKAMTAIEHPHHFLGLRAGAGGYVTYFWLSAYIGQ
jgi:hypothetical protein